MTVVRDSDFTWGTCIVPHLILPLKMHVTRIPPLNVDFVWQVGISWWENNIPLNSDSPIIRLVHAMSITFHIDSHPAPFSGMGLKLDYIQVMHQYLTTPFLNAREV